MTAQINQSKDGTGAIRLTQRFRAPPRRVFDAWLDPEVTGQWLFATATRPMTEVEINPRVGGSSHLADRRNGEIIEYHGRYEEIAPHRRLVFSFSDRRRGARTMRVIVEITPRKRGCELNLSHENVPPDCIDDTVARWTGMFYGLSETLASRPKKKYGSK